jgi:voltage-gated sodium channel
MELVSQRQTVQTEMDDEQGRSPDGDIRSLRTKRFGLTNMKTSAMLESERPTEFGPWRSKIRELVSNVRFSAVSAFVIILNAAFIGFETDFNEPHPNDDTMWLAMEACFSVYFVVELTLRYLAHDPRSFIYDWWNVFDVVIVTTASVDIILSLALEGGESGGGQLTILRIFRIFRLVRIFRLLRFFRKLWLLVSSIAGASKLLIWVWLLLVIIMYIFAVFMTRVVGNTHNDDPVAQKHVGSVSQSMLTFFIIMTLESWPDIARDLGPIEPVSIPVIVLYLTVTTYAVLNVVIAVIVDVTLSRAKEIKDDSGRQALKEQQNLYCKILEVFQRADENGDGLLTKDEFEKALQTKEVLQGLHGVQVNPADADEIFDILDQDESGTLTYIEFLNGIQRARSHLSAKHILELQCDIWKSAHQSEKYVQELSERMDRIADRTRMRTDQLEKVIESVRSSFETQIARVLESITGQPYAPRTTRLARPDSTEIALDALCKEIG